MAAYNVTKEKDGVIYEETINNTLIVKDAGHAKYTNLMIPAEVQGLPVVGVAPRAFVGSKAKTVLFPASLVSVGRNAFYGNGNIKTVNFTATEVSIAEGAFEGCFKLQKVRAIKLRLNGPRVFNRCKALEEFDARVFGVVYAHCFANCKRLDVLKFCDDITIMEEAFYGCMSLKQFYFEGNANINPAVTKFIEKRTIFCKPDSPLVELAYSGADIRMGSFQ